MDKLNKMLYVAKTAVQNKIPSVFMGFISPENGSYELIVWLVGSGGEFNTITESYTTLEEAQKRADELKAKYPNKINNGTDIWVYDDSIRELITSNAD